MKRENATISSSRPIEIRFGDAASEFRFDGFFFGYFYYPAAAGGIGR